MKRIVGVVAAALFLLVLLAPGHAWAFGVKDVVSMSRAGIPDSLIIEKIRHSGTEFDLSSKDLLKLRQENVPDRVVVAMLRTEDRDRTGVWYNGRLWPYDPSWSARFDLGWYGPYDPFFDRPYFHGGWRGPRFGSRAFVRSRR